MELPAPRLINLIWYRYSEGCEREDKLKLRASLEEAGRGVIHPLKELMIEKSRPVKKKPRATEPGITGSGPMARPRKIPSWWQGERAAYQSAKVAMKDVASLPKMKS